MSGICAVWRKENPGRVAETLSSINAGLSLRGAERIGQKTEPGAGVGVCAVFATQQVYENRNVLLACDAELYNEKELQQYVPANAGEFPQARTAALLSGLYERFGAGFVEKLQGSFSIVLWDRLQRKLVAAVDGFGINRLVYFENDKVFLIASRIDALTRAGEIVPEVNPRAIANFLNFGVNLAPETALTSVRRLCPGTLLITDTGSTRTETFWDMQYGVGDERDEERLSRELEDVVEKAVAAQCQDGDFAKLGAYLSGGTDSSTVVGMMTRTGRGPVKAFSIGFEEERFNELEYAEITARKFHADHHTYRVSADDCRGALPDMVRYFDEPFANASAIPTYFCARLAAQHGVTSLLAGDGGDELFGGNERYLSDKVFQTYQTVPAFLRRGLIEPALKLVPVETGLIGKARKYVRRSNIPRVDRIFSYHFLCCHPWGDVFQGDFLETLKSFSILETPWRYYREARAKDDLDRFLYLDVKVTLGDSDLPKVTQMSELAGVQTRFPFLDRSVAEMSGRIPAGLKLKGVQKRYLFKRAFANLLPIEVIKKKKHGFGIPVAVWLKSDPRLREWSRDILFSSGSLARGYFKREFLENLIRWHEADDTTFYGDTLWSLFVLELWHRQYIDEAVAV
jgi:asparagine synthase (glutamine-hydrolysing)